MIHTERPDRFCRGLMDGRVGVLIDGIPLGCLVPCDLNQFLRTSQDLSYHWAIVSVLTLLRYLSIFITVLLPGFYIAVSAFHLQMIPTQLALSIIASKQDVPFSTQFEVLAMLLAFELLQEAGLRMPKTIGQSVSIIGALVVGQAAVEAKIVSPAVIIGLIDPERDRILFTKYADRDYKKYALIAGFSEIGETLEQTVAREVKEEVGLSVKNIRYYKNQPWAFTGTLLVGFFAELDGADDITLEEDELGEATWFTRENIPPTDNDISLTAEMMEVFRRGEEK